MDLSKYKKPLSPLSSSVISSLSKEAVLMDFHDPSHCDEIVKLDIHDGVYKDKNSSYFVKCTTLMPAVTPLMIDWWFAWHLPDSERYKLWHPLDHVSSKLTQDRSNLNSDKERYIGINSYVEEYIGKKYSKLCISFLDPKEFGLGDLDADSSTAVCARVTDMETGVKIANLLHYVEIKDIGSEMHSYFWLGSNLEHDNKLINFFLTYLSKIQFLKGSFINTKLATDLLRHCYEEMNHLVSFLPELYKDIGTSSNLRKSL